MSGLNIKLGYSDFGASQKFQQLAARFTNMTPLMRELGRRVQDAALERFTSNIGPDGTAWAPSQRVLESQGVDKTLLHIGKLRESIVYDAGAREVRVGTNIPYAAIHQFGGRAGRGLSVELPARPYLGLSDQDERDLMDITSDYWDESFAKGAFA